MIVIITDGGNRSAFSYQESETVVFSDGKDDEINDIYSSFYRDCYPYTGREKFIEYIESHGFKRVAFEEIPM